MRLNILIILVIFSCSDDFDPTSGADLCILAGTSFTNTSGSYVYENIFDSSNRITNIISNGTEVAKFDYKDTIVYATLKGFDNQIITFNNQGLPIRAVDETDKLIWKVYYSEGKPLSIIVPTTLNLSPNYRYDSIAMKLDMAGNIIKNEVYVFNEIIQNWQLQFAIEYTYDDKINPWRGLLLYGTLLGWTQYFSVNNQLSVGRETYTYTYYDLGYPSSRKGGGTENFTYQYNCF